MKIKFSMRYWVALSLLFLWLAPRGTAQNDLTIPENLVPITSSNAADLTEIGKPFFRHPKYTRVVRFSHGNDYLFGGFWFGEHILWSLDPLAEVARIDLSIPICNAVFSPDDAVIAISDYDGYTYVYDIQKGEVVFTTNRFVERPELLDYVCGVNFNESSMAYIDQGIVHFWNYTTRAEPESWEIAGDQLLFSPDGREIAVSQGDGKIEIWETQTRTLKSTLAAHDARISSFAFSSDGKLLVSGDDRWHVYLWDLETGEPLYHLESEDHYTRGIAHLSFSPDNSLLIFSGATYVTVWDVDMWVPVEVDSRFTQPQIVDFNADGSLIISNTLGGALELWDFTIGQIAYYPLSKNSKCQEYWGNALDMTSDGRVIATGYECGIVRLWGVRE